MEQKQKEGQLNLKAVESKVHKSAKQKDTAGEVWTSRIKVKVYAISSLILEPGRKSEEIQKHSKVRKGGVSQRAKEDSIFPKQEYQSQKHKVLACNRGLFSKQDKVIEGKSRSTLKAMEALGWTERSFLISSEDDQIQRTSKELGQRQQGLGGNSWSVKGKVSAPLSVQDPQNQSRKTPTSSDWGRRTHLSAMEEATSRAHGKRPKTRYVQLPQPNQFA